MTRFLTDPIVIDLLLAVFVLVALVILGLVVWGFLAERNGRGISGDKVQTWTAVSLLLGEAVLAAITYAGTQIAMDSMVLAQRSLEIQTVQTDLALEYIQWTSGLSKSNEQLDLELVGTRRATTHELQCFDLTILPLYLDSSTNIVDDPDTPLQPELKLGCAEVSRESKRDGESDRMIDRLTVTDIRGMLLAKYDGRPQMSKVASERAYRLHALEIRFRYWHTSQQDRAFSLAVRVPVDDSSQIERPLFPTRNGRMP